MILYVGFQTFHVASNLEETQAYRFTSHYALESLANLLQFGSNVDTGMPAGVLVAAAADGKPFCPESEKAHAAPVAAGDQS